MAPEHSTIRRDACTFGGADRQWLYLCSTGATMAGPEEGSSRG